MVRTPRCGVFNDMGSGKTISALTALEIEFRRGLIKKALVVAPLEVSKNTWPQEVPLWEHVSDLSFKFIRGAPAKRAELLKGGERVHILNQENFVWLVERAYKNWPYDRVIFDDTQGFKTSERVTKPKSTICILSDTCPIYANAYEGVCEFKSSCTDYRPDVDAVSCANPCSLFRQVKRASKACEVVCNDFTPKPARYTRFGALLAVSGKIKKLAVLTGTPSSKELLDLWPLVYVLDGGKRLSPSYNKYKQTYFNKSHNGYNWDLREGSKQKIFKRISDICISIDSEAELPRRHDIEVKLKMPPDIEKMYDRFAKEYYLSLTKGDVLAVNRGVLEGKLLQVCEGAVYLSHDPGDRREWEPLHDVKLNALDPILEKHKNTPVIIAYNHGHGLARLREKYPHGVTLKDVKNGVAMWNNGEIPLLFLHPKSGGHGLNLQKGPGHVLIWFGINWSLDDNRQLNKRLWRPGQKNAVYIYHLVMEGKADRRIVELVNKKGATQNELIEAVKRDIKNK
jgi:SNF2 family DNA or RNA helicase